MPDINLGRITYVLDDPGNATGKGGGGVPPNGEHARGGSEIPNGGTDAPGGNNGLIFRARRAGEAGNGICINFVADGASSPLYVTTPYGFAPPPAPPPPNVPPTGGKKVSTHHQSDYLPSTMNYGLGDYVLLGEWAAQQAASDLAIDVYAYSSAFTARDSFFTGLTASEALAGGHELRDSGGNVLSNAVYQPSVLCDPGRAAYQAAWVTKVVSRIRDVDGAQGVFIDDLVQSSHIASGTPAIYPTQPQWRAAVEEFVSVVVPQLKAAGLKVMLNAGAWWPGHGTGGTPNYDDGSATIDWAGTLGTLGGTGGTGIKCMIEPGFQTVDSFPGTTRLVGSAWYQNWDGWANVITQLEALGIDYVGMAHGGVGDSALNQYLKGSMLLFMNRPESSCMLHCDAISSSPLGPRMSADLGLPLGPATLTGQVWARNFEGGSVQVNPYTGTAAITVY